MVTLPPPSNIRAIKSILERILPDGILFLIKGVYSLLRNFKFFSTIS